MTAAKDAAFVSPGHTDVTEATGGYPGTGQIAAQNGAHGLGCVVVGEDVVDQLEVIQPVDLRDEREVVEAHMIMCSSCAASDSNHHTSSRWATTTLGSTMLRLGRPSFDPPDIAIHDDAVRHQRISCRTTQHVTGTNIELRAVQWTGDRCAVELALAQSAATMRACGLGGTEVPVHVEDSNVATNQQT